MGSTDGIRAASKYPLIESIDKSLLAQMSEVEVARTSSCLGRFGKGAEDLGLPLAAPQSGEVVVEPGGVGVAGENRAIGTADEGLPS
jgi:hypothetical protein